MTKKNHPQPTTLDDLAAMINHGFTETQQYLDKRLGGMDLRLGKMDQQMNDMKGVLKDMVQELTATHEDVWRRMRPSKRSALASPALRRKSG